MAGPGRPRKDPDMRARPSNRLADLSVVKPTEVTLPPWDGVRRGPTLEPHRPEGGLWHPRTHTWWLCWQDSPQAMFMADTDWEALLVAAIIHDRICRGASSTALANLSGELRKREGMIGSSIEDRRRLGLGDPGGAKEAADESVVKQEATELVDYVERLLKYTGEDTNET